MRDNARIMLAIALGRVQKEFAAFVDVVYEDEDKSFYKKCAKVGNLINDLYWPIENGAKDSPRVLKANRGARGYVYTIYHMKDKKDRVPSGRAKAKTISK